MPKAQQPEALRQIAEAQRADDAPQRARGEAALALMRFMCSEAGMVPIAPPSTQQVTGRVARPARASASPARPLMAISVGLLSLRAWRADPWPRRCGAYCLPYCLYIQYST